MTKVECEIHKATYPTGAFHQAQTSFAFKRHEIYRFFIRKIVAASYLTQKVQDILVTFGNKPTDELLAARMEKIMDYGNFSVAKK